LHPRCAAVPERALAKLRVPFPTIACWLGVIPVRVTRATRTPSSARHQAVRARDGAAELDRPRAREPSSRSLPAVDGTLKLRLVPRRPSPKIELLGLAVELLVRAAFDPVRSRAQTTTPSGRDISCRGRGTGARLTRPGALLVDRAGRDLLGAGLGSAAPSLALLDVLVLTSPL